MSRICLVLTGESLLENAKFIKNSIDCIDMVELRADYLLPEERASVSGFTKTAGLPVLLTANPLSQGGLFEGGEDEREAFLLGAVEGAAAGGKPFAFVDVNAGSKMDSLEAAAAAAGTRIVRSFHDFNGTPENLAQKMRSFIKRSDEIAKAAVRPKNLDDVALLIEEARNFNECEKVFISMGRQGICTRILAEQIGSAWTFACAQTPNGVLASAAGQISPEELCSFYRFRSINKDTAVYGILGWPLEASSSPEIFNGAFSHTNRNAVYIAFPSENADAFMRLAEVINLQGAAVTVPHKKAVISGLAQASEGVKNIGACNTIVRNEDGWRGYNTDAKGFSDSLLEWMGRKDLRGVKTVLIGAGGAANAAAFELSRLGAGVLIVNRTLETAQKLADAYVFKSASLKERDVSLKIAQYSDLIINTTSVGMEPRIENDPLEMYQFNGSEKVMDVIYKPAQTRFLRRAAKAGCLTLNGRDMLERQAHLQYLRYFNEPYPFPLKS
ncbi:MAG: type I 3-dehydroquinate dehydratase [Spirochaetaceae bacterium]|jgi:3-dehydroquinate dehydratase/shikimate dehydrogenase|nr:type I 3-dehydroquinate dehydratase [Spirochaetaceae bacterium]